MQKLLTSKLSNYPSQRLLSTRDCFQLEVYPWPKWGTHTNTAALRFILTMFISTMFFSSQVTTAKQTYQRENHLNESKFSTVAASCQVSLEPVLLP